MIVYGEADQPADPSALLNETARRWRTLSQRLRPPHDELRGELIALGEIEAAIGDALCPEADCIDSRLRELRGVSIALGGLFWRSWRGLPAAPGDRHLGTLAATLDALAHRAWPAEVRLRPAEGYAHYGLFPEGYGEAAAALAAENAMALALVVGIRSIGTSLSAVVAGALAQARKRASRSKAGAFGRADIRSRARSRSMPGCAGLGRPPPAPAPWPSSWMKAPASAALPSCPSGRSCGGRGSPTRASS
jgi:hypothetical protein